MTIKLPWLHYHFMFYHLSCFLQSKSIKRKSTWIHLIGIHSSWHMFACIISVKAFDLNYLTAERIQFIQFKLLINLDDATVHEYTMHPPHPFLIALSWIKMCSDNTCCFPAPLKCTHTGTLFQRRRRQLQQSPPKKLIVTKLEICYLNSFLDIQVHYIHSHLSLKQLNWFLLRVAAMATVRDTGQWQEALKRKKKCMAYPKARKFQLPEKQFEQANDSLAFQGTKK